jgi:peptidoglycan/LPS O-acetylase OafA/YrhL
VFAGIMLTGDIGILYPDNRLIFGKHPPDLAYLSLYTGLSLLLIALHSHLEGINHTLPLKLLTLLGQTALFFYIIHLRLIELLSPLIAPLPLPPLERSLLIVLAALPLLLILCRWYRRLKRQHPSSLLQYL